MGRFLDELELLDVPEEIPWNGWKDPKREARFELIRKIEAKNDDLQYEAMLADYRYDTVMDAIDKIEGIVDKVMDGILQMHAASHMPKMNINVVAPYGADLEEVKEYVAEGVSQATGIRHDLISEGKISEINITVDPAKVQSKSFKV